MASTHGRGVCSVGGGRWGWRGSTARRMPSDRPPLRRPLLAARGIPLPFPRPLNIFASGYRFSIAQGAFLASRCEFSSPIIPCMRGGNGAYKQVDPLNYELVVHFLFRISPYGGRAPTVMEMSKTKKNIEACITKTDDHLRQPFNRHLHLLFFGRSFLCPFPPHYLPRCRYFFIFCFENTQHERQTHVRAVTFGGLTPLHCLALYNAHESGRSDGDGSQSQAQLTKTASISVLALSKPVTTLHHQKENKPSSSLDHSVRIITDMLLCAGAEIDAVDHEGNTPLLTAARTAGATLVELLLARGANPDARLKKTLACR